MFEKINVELREIEEVEQAELKGSRLDLLQHGFDPFEKVLKNASDPITLDKACSPYKIIDGRHRVWLARQRGYTSITARVIPEMIKQITTGAHHMTMDRYRTKGDQVIDANRRAENADQASKEVRKLEQDARRIAMAMLSLESSGNQEQQAEQVAQVAYVKRQTENLQSDLVEDAEQKIGVIDDYAEGAADEARTAAENVQKIERARSDLLHGDPEREIEILKDQQVEVSDFQGDESARMKKHAEEVEYEVTDTQNRINNILKQI